MDIAGSKQLKQEVEQMVEAGDPSVFACAIASGKFKTLSDDVLRESLAQSFDVAARSEGGSSDPDSAGIRRQLRTMALDLRYNPGKLSLLEQIFIFYPNVKPKI